MPRRRKQLRASKRYWVGYCRKSTDTEDKQIHSLQDQATMIEDYYGRLAPGEKEQGKLLLLSEAQSAYRPGRPVFESILHMASRGEVHGMIVVHPNRISRNHADSGSFVQRLVDRQITCLDTVAGKRYTGADSNDIFMLTLEGAMSWKDSRDKGDRVLQAMRLRAKEGKHMGPVRLGYRSVYRPDGTKVLQFTSDAPIVCRLFELAAAGTHSLSDLVQVAWEAGLRSRHGAKVRQSGIHAMLHDPIYKGFIHFDGILVKGLHQPLVEESTWARVQSALMSRRTATGRPKDLTLRDLFFFGNLLRCPRCNQSLRPYRVKGKYIYYECKNPETRCGVCVPQKTLVQQLPLLLEGVFLTPADLERLRKKLLGHFRRGSGDMLGLRRLLNEDYEKLEKEISDLFSQRKEAEAMGVLAPIDRRLAELKKQLDGVQSQLNATHESNTAWIDKVIRAFELADLLQEAIFHGSRHPREMALRAIASNLSVEGKDLVLNLRSPFRESAGKGGVPDWYPGLYDVRTEITETVCLLEMAYSLSQNPIQA